MAQRIWLIRHGKSSRPVGVIDHERPLSARASNDAALIRAWLRPRPAVFVASTARRAVETAELLAGERPVHLDEALYQAGEEEFLAVVEAKLETAVDVAFVAHNPTITGLVNELAGRVVADSVPTLGVAAFLRGDGERKWRLADYVAPKQLRQSR